MSQPLRTVEHQARGSVSNTLVSENKHLSLDGQSGLPTLENHATAGREIEHVDGNSITNPFPVQSYDSVESSYNKKVPVSSSRHSIKRKLVPRVTPEPPKPKAHPTSIPAQVRENSTDTEDELELIELLSLKANTEVQAGRTQSAERVLSKVLRRYEALSTNEKTYAPNLFATSLQIAELQETLLEWDKALISLDNAIKYCPDGQHLNLEIKVIWIYIHKQDYATAMKLVSKSLAECRKKYGKMDEHYYGVLALKCHILKAQDDVDEAEVLLATLPTDFESNFDLKAFSPFQARSVSANLEGKRLGSRQLKPGCKSEVSSTIQQEKSETSARISEPETSVKIYQNSSVPSWLRLTDGSIPFSSIETLRQIAREGSLEDLRHILSKATSHQLLGLQFEGDTMLHVLTRNQNLPAITEYLLAGGSDEVGIFNKGSQFASPCTPLHIAAAIGNAELVKLLFKHGANEIVEKEHTPEYPTALWYAAALNRINVLEILLDHGWSALVNKYAIQMSSLVHYTALHVAAFEGHSSVVKFLLRHGADAMAYHNAVPIQYHPAKHLPPRQRFTKATPTPLQLAAAQGHAKVVELLLAHGVVATAYAKGTESPLQLAVIPGHEAVVKLLLVHGMDAMAFFNATDTPLRMAVRLGHEAVVKLLLVHGADAAAYAKGTATPLQLAVIQGHEAIAKLLIEHGADVNFPDDYKLNRVNMAFFEVEAMPLMVAVNANDENIARLLLENGARLKSRQINLVSLSPRNVKDFAKTKSMKALLKRFEN